MQKADCHSHTYFSDGSLSPVGLLDLAKKQELTGLSITDHDTIDAYDVALPYSQLLGIDLLSGIEISTEHRKVSVHVLGYGFDLNHEKIKSFCLKLQSDRQLRNVEILTRLQAYKIFISMEELKEAFPYGTLGRPHIATLMVRKGYVKSVSQAFYRFLGEKCPCYVSGFHLAVEQAIELIKQVGGFSVLAHPHYIRSQRVMIELLSMPFDGIEAYYGYLPVKEEQVWVNLALKKGLFVTGGSDFHGDKKAKQTLGCSWTPPENFAMMLNHFKQYCSSINNGSPPEPIP